MNRVRARIGGTVQGVGFRPYVHRLAREMGVSGLVLNDSEGVIVEAEADAPTLERFLVRLPLEVPPLARVEAIDVVDVAPSGDQGFAIVPSRGGGAVLAPVPADAATCDDCLAELFDPANRRHRYPFVNCTNCGPRFTIVRGVPYDRPLTTMAGFEMCAACRAEYEDPADRRFHAEPNACPECGPRLRYVGAGGDAANALLGGRIVAVKGLGGYHLACRADDEAVVARLRSRKHREDKPFALMVRDLHAARRLARVGAADAALLTARGRPIVLVRRRADARVARSVALDSRDLGLMLPYTPLHHLLLADTGVPLVMTSGNVSDEPIAFRDEDAMARLAGIADGFLVHDRPIETRTDDSVVRTVGGRAQFLRRSRGHVPESLPLPVGTPAPLLAVGAELKNTFCVAVGERAWVSHHVGDLKNFETLESFRAGIGHFERLLRTTPEVVVHDLHPDYLSTRHALELDGTRLLGVQHHHAHLAAVLAEHGETGPATGAIYDGAGLGTDGTVWGGEILFGDLMAFERVTHLAPVRLPGGDVAARQPWRMACAWLDGARPAGLDVDSTSWEQVAHMARTGLASPETTSMGRLFDAVAALCGLRAEVTYEGQAAIALESACAPGEHGVYDCEGLDLRPVVAAIADDIARGEPVAVVAARFHDTIAAQTAEACANAARARDVDTVVLAGGVFQNRRLIERTHALLRDRGLRVLLPERLPPGDGGISYGQAAMGAAFLAAEGGDVRA